MSQIAIAPSHPTEQDVLSFLVDISTPYIQHVETEYLFCDGIAGICYEVQFGEWYNELSLVDVDSRLFLAINGPTGPFLTTLERSSKSKRSAGTLLRTNGQNRRYAIARNGTACL